MCALARCVFALLLVCGAAREIVGDVRALDDGQLDVEPNPTAHDLQEVVFQLSAPMLLCGDYTIQLSANGTISLERRRCRMRHGKQTRKVYCDRQEGHTYEFDRFARFLAGSGVLAQPGSETFGFRWQDVAAMTLFVTLKSGVQLSRSWEGPESSMPQWETWEVLNGMIADQEWTGRPKEVPCEAK